MLVFCVFQSEVRVREAGNREGWTAEALHHGKD